MSELCLPTLMSDIVNKGILKGDVNYILQVQQILIMMLRIMLFAPMMLIGSIIMAMSKDAKLSLILLIIMPIIGICVFVVGKKVCLYLKPCRKSLIN